MVLQELLGAYSDTMEINLFFGALDTNNDGQISIDEWDLWFSKMQQGLDTDKILVFLKRLEQAEIQQSKAELAELTAAIGPSLEMLADAQASLKELRRAKAGAESNAEQLVAEAALLRKQLAEQMNTPSEQDAEVNTQVVTRQLAARDAALAALQAQLTVDGEALCKSQADFQQELQAHAQSKRALADAHTQLQRLATAAANVSPRPPKMPKSPRQQLQQEQAPQHSPRQQLKQEQAPQHSPRQQLKQEQAPQHSPRKQLQQEQAPQHSPRQQLPQQQALQHSPQQQSPREQYARQLSPRESQLQSELLLRRIEQSQSPQQQSPQQQYAAPQPQQPPQDPSDRRSQLSKRSDEILAAAEKAAARLRSSKDAAPEATKEGLWATKVVNKATKEELLFELAHERDRHAREEAKRIQMILAQELEAQQSQIRSGPFVPPVVPALRLDELNSAPPVHTAPTTFRGELSSVTQVALNSVTHTLQLLCIFTLLYNTALHSLF